MKKIVSIDLETLDVKTTAVILEIGIVVGDDQGTLIEQFRMYPDIQEQIDAGRSVSAETLMWWLRQEEPIQANQSEAKRQPWLKVNEEYWNFMSRHKDCGFVLGNAPSFDCDILSSYIGKKLWPFYVERDVRTARMMLTSSERYANPAEHDALADAMAQYMDFVAFLSKRNG